jgi:hypothetical protein
MDRDHNHRPILSRAVALTLAYLEIGIQVLSLSLLPSANLSAGLNPSTPRSETRRASVSSDTAPRSAARLLRDLFTSFLPESPDGEDGDLEQSHWPHVEVVVRQKCGSQPILPKIPPPPLSSAKLGTMDEGTPLVGPFRQVLELPIHLCRLTC